MNEQNPFPMIDVSADARDRYRPAMSMSAEHAAVYFARLVEWQMTKSNCGREAAEQIERSNLGYFAGYYDAVTRKRVLEVFGASHPVFGNSCPDAATAYAMV